ncbi:MAG: sulfite exporter TauE/SafE family protein [Flammeovirgaceae bacterium]|nr:MAG: sulfite exporter TauE/SafE family protein [Flammeovirgaceae bacterium]
MEIDYLTNLFIIVIGFIAGFLNTVAGGGSLISLPILIFLGLPGSVANATSRVAILAQNVFAVTGFNSKGIKLPMPYSIFLCIASLIGGLIGAKLAVDIRDALFNRILAIIMILVVLSIVLEKKVKSEHRAERLSVRHQVLGTFAFVLLGIYGGFIQAGIGFLVIAVLTNINHLSLVKTNYVKVFAAIVYTGVSVIVFTLENKIVWTTGLVLAIGQGFGGWYASRWSVEKGDVWIKRIMIVTVIALAVKLWFF